MNRMSDTLAAAARAQDEAWRRLGPQGRIAVAIDLSERVREIAMDGIRTRHPEYSHEEARNAMLRLVLGDELYRAAWPDRPLLPS